MPESTTSPVWLITGCSTGFGRALAEKVLATGATLGANVRAADSIADLVAAYPKTCRPLVFDVTDRAALEAAVAPFLAETGRLDILVNNAGYGLIGPFEEATPEQIEQSFATLLFGALHLLRAVLPTLRAQRSGRIINLSAAAAIANYPGFSIYGAAKFALEGVSESLAAELKPLGIKVTLVQPGPFRTDFIGRSLARTATELTDYAGTAGKFTTFIEKMDGQQPGDPARAAAAILQIAESENPPLRLVLGKYAIEKTERTLKARQRELDAWKELGLTADFPA